jgi:hypothetical protein
MSSLVINIIHNPKTASYSMTIANPGGDVTPELDALHRLIFDKNLAKRGGFLPTDACLLVEFADPVEFDKIAQSKPSSTEV